MSPRSVDFVFDVFKPCQLRLAQLVFSRPGQQRVDELMILGGLSLGLFMASSSTSRQSRW
jgi:hypothetical protein